MQAYKITILNVWKEDVTDALPSIKSEITEDIS